MLMNLCLSFFNIKIFCYLHKIDDLSEQGNNQQNIKLRDKKLILEKKINK